MNDIIKQLRAFSKDRGWEKFQNPGELARAAFIECGELNELYLWGKNPDLYRSHEELADVLIYIIMICDYLGLDENGIKQIIRNKIHKNSIKYPCPSSDEQDALWNYKLS